MIAEPMRRRLPEADAEYLLTASRLVLTVTLTVAALVYIARGGRLERLVSP